VCRRSRYEADGGAPILRRRRWRTAARLWYHHLLGRQRQGEQRSRSRRRRGPASQGLRPTSLTPVPPRTPARRGQMARIFLILSLAAKAAFLFTHLCRSPPSPVAMRHRRSPQRCEATGRQEGRTGGCAVLPDVTLGDLGERANATKPEIVDPSPGLGDWGQQSIASLGFHCRLCAGRMNDAFHGLKP
jgi:hypothetical protein